MTSDCESTSRTNGAEAANRLLRSATDETYSLQLLSRDQPLVKTVDKDILCAASSYIREVVEAMPYEGTPIFVPVSARILDALIEVVYTTASAGPLEAISVRLSRDDNLSADHVHRVEDLFPSAVVFVSYDDLPEFFLAAELFRLKELTSRLRTFFRNNMQSCFLHDNFLLNWSHEDIVRFLKSIFTPIGGPRDQSNFLQNIRDWATNNLVDLTVETEIADHIKAINPKSECVRRPFSCALLITNYECYQFRGKSLVNYSAGLKLREIFGSNLDIDPYTSPIVIRGYNMFVITGRHLLVFHVTRGTLVQSYENVFRNQLCRKTLILWEDRVYCSDDFTIYEVTMDGVQALYTARRGPIGRFAVIEHNEDRLDLCFSSRDELYRTICDRGGSVLDEGCILCECIPIGAEDGYAFFWQVDQMMLVVKKAGTPILLYRFKDLADDYVHCGPEVYIKFLRHIDIVDTTNGLVRTVSPVPTFGRLIACTV
ncbi:hypothetical protein BIW11_06495 [Tropilaelaps mercedesae]|uniref:BTB domain-containing protein n=1 Tax=Tropilaelaps mercedesae TaxID=418985 RepID=A0A1V9XXZ3_9ACAR|nr:hypothetical protein BIW11_06495 [Tropilaelaps mercedesae]